MQRLAPFITRDRSKINGESDLREIQLYATSNKNELLSTLDAFGKTAIIFIGQLSI